MATSEEKIDIPAGEDSGSNEWDEFLTEEESFVENSPTGEVSTDEAEAPTEEEPQEEEVSGEAEPETAGTQKEEAKPEKEEKPATQADINAALLEQMRHMQEEFQRQTQAATQTYGDPAAQADAQRQSREQQRMQALAQLQKVYMEGISDDEADNFLSDPRTVMSKLLAQAHLSAVEQSVTLMQHNAPQVVSQLVRQQAAYEREGQAFFNRWPKLAGHVDQVNKIAMSWRQQNPQASSQDFMENVGPLAHALLRIPVEDEAQPQPAPAESTAPPPPPPRAGVQPRRSPKPSNLNPFEQLAEEMLAEDD